MITERDPEGRIVRQGPGWALAIPQSDTRPPKPKTDFSHPKCYAASLKDCSDQLTREHYISAVVLRRLAGPTGTLEVTGIPSKESPRMRLRVNDLATRKLCERHNRVLSPLDTLAGRVFDALCDIGTYLKAGRDFVVGVNGHDFERWLLKYLCGVLAVRGQAIPVLWLRILFGQNSLLTPRGLYTYASVGDVCEGDKVLLEIAHEDDLTPIGCRVQLLNTEFVLAMTDRPPAALEHVGKLRVSRPGGFEMTYPTTGARFVLAFSWQGDASHASTRAIWSPKTAVA